MDETLDYIRRELRYRLGVADSEVMLDSARVLSDRSDTRGAVVTLVNIRVSPYQGSGLRPPELLDLVEMVLLFSFRFQDYKTSLMHLYRTIRLFHEKPAYAAAESHPENPFPANLDRMFFTLCPLEFDALKNLWAMLGGAHYPSVVYNLRLVQTKKPMISSQ